MVVLIEMTLGLMETGARNSHWILSCLVLSFLEVIDSLEAFEASTHGPSFPRFHIETSLSVATDKLPTTTNMESGNRRPV